MYLSTRLQVRPLLREALVPVIVTATWSVTVVYLHEVANFKWIVLPVLPVTLVGIAVSLYVAFKNASAYSRWWEARTALGLIFAQSREFVIQINSLVQTNPDGSEKPTEHPIVERILQRHIGWVYLAANMLRRQSRLKNSRGRRLFGHRSTEPSHVRIVQHANAYPEFLDSKECAAAEAYHNPPYFLMLQQANDLRKLADAGVLDPIRHVALTELLGRLTVAYGACERIKFTPFPRQVTLFGRLFTWVLVMMLPLAFLDVFEKEARLHDLSTNITHGYVFALAPFAVLISWIFLMMERVSESHEDPFEGGATDVPLSAIIRQIEIDVKQALQSNNIPEPLQPVDNTLY